MDIDWVQAVPQALIFGVASIAVKVVMSLNRSVQELNRTVDKIVTKVEYTERSLGDHHERLRDLERDPVCSN